MTPEQRTARLIQLMDVEHRISAEEVGKIINRAAQTVRSWRSKYEARTIPETMLRVLEIELADRAKAKARQAKKAPKAAK